MIRLLVRDLPDLPSIETENRCTRECKQHRRMSRNHELRNFSNSQVVQDAQKRELSLG